MEVFGDANLGFLPEQTSSNHFASSEEEDSISSDEESTTILPGIGAYVDDDSNSSVDSDSDDSIPPQYEPLSDMDM